MDPLARLADVLRHVGEERDDVMVQRGLELVDALDLEGGPLAYLRSLFLRDADLAEFGLGLACQYFDLFPDLELVGC
jgi:hypothetical protein